MYMCISSCSANLCISSEVYKLMQCVFVLLFFLQGAEVLADLHRSSPLSAFAYDSILTLAMLLNRTLAVIDNGNVDCQNRNGTRVRLEDFGYDNDLMGCVFLNVLRSLSFKGTSVRTI